MQIELIDQLPAPAEGTCRDIDALACAESSDPVVAIADMQGVKRLQSIGIDPVAVVSPSKSMPWRNRHMLERVLRRIGATTVVCRSEWSYELASLLSGVYPVRPDSDITPLKPDSQKRVDLRASLELMDSHNLLVPLANHPEQIDSLVVCMCASAIAIPNVPVVMMLPSRAKHIARARGFLSNADRVLQVIVTDTPTAYFAPAADAMIWGPHAIDEDPNTNATRCISWAQGAGVPVLCPSQFLDIQADSASDGQLYSCNGTGAADVAAPLLSIFGRPA